MTDLNISVPLSVSRADYDQEEAKSRYQVNKALIQDRYHYEKFMGKRQENGAKKLNELSPEHKQWIACYINGMKGVEIAEQYNVAAITVYRVLADPLAKGLIDQFDDGFKDEFRAMFPLVSLAVREGLESGTASTRLKSVDRWAKICRLLDGKDEEGGETKKSDTVFAARMRFVELIKDAQETAANGRAGTSSALIERTVEIEVMAGASAPERL